MADLAMLALSLVVTAAVLLVPRGAAARSEERTGAAHDSTGRTRTS
ncbi:hypothetical protein [Saccharopolyspora rhizosphaerae]|nr:hypothetical protein [Saccharopolyspora rhizosphaerae]